LHTTSRILSWFQNPDIFFINAFFTLPHGEISAVHEGGGEKSLVMIIVSLLAKDI
jgi:hypothetical protein